MKRRTSQDALRNGWEHLQSLSTNNIRSMKGVFKGFEDYDKPASQGRIHLSTCLRTLRSLFELLSWDQEEASRGDNNLPSMTTDSPDNYIETTTFCSKASDDGHCRFNDTARKSNLISEWFVSPASFCHQCCVGMGYGRNLSLSDTYAEPKRAKTVASFMVNES